MKSTRDKRMLAQGQTSVSTVGFDDFRKGYFLDLTNKREVGKSMDVVVLRVDTKRVLFYDKKNPAPPGHKGPRCASDDGILPSARIKNPQADECASCEFANKDMVYTVIAMDVNDTRSKSEPIIFEIEFKSTQLKIVRAFVKSIQDRKKNARDYVVTMKSEMQEAVKDGQKVTWYVPRFDSIAPVPSDVKAEVEAAYNSVSGILPIEEDEEPAF